MNAGQLTVHELNLLVEEFELFSNSNWENLIKYLADTNDDESIRKRRIAHVEKLREQSRKLTNFRQRFHQSMLQAIAEICFELSQDNSLKGATLNVGFTDDKFSPTYPFKISLYFV